MRPVCTIEDIQVMGERKINFSFENDLVVDAYRASLRCCRRFERTAPANAQTTLQAQRQ